MLDKEIREPFVDFLENFTGKSVFLKKKSLGCPVQMQLGVIDGQLIGLRSRVTMIHMHVCRGRRQIMMSCVM